MLPASCRTCGAALDDGRRDYCTDCRREQLASHAVGARAKAAAVLAQLRAAQRDPSHGGRAAKLRGTKNAAHQHPVHAWKGERPDTATFTRDILPSLQRIPVPNLVAATGLSAHYCSLIRLGKKTPTRDTGRHSELPPPAPERETSGGRLHASGVSRSVDLRRVRTARRVRRHELDDLLHPLPRVGVDTPLLGDGGA